MLQPRVLFLPVILFHHVIAIMINTRNIPYYMYEHLKKVQIRPLSGTNTVPLLICCSLRGLLTRFHKFSALFVKTHESFASFVYSVDFF